MELAANLALDHHLIRATPRFSPDGYSSFGGRGIYNCRIWEARLAQKPLHVRGSAPRLACGEFFSVPIRASRQQNRSELSIFPDRCLGAFLNEARLSCNGTPYCLRRTNA